MMYYLSSAFPMDAFRNIEEDINRREKEFKARELETRLNEIEQEINGISSPAAEPERPEPLANNAKKTTATTPQKKRFSFKLNKAAKFWAIVVGVIVGIRLLTVMSAAMFVLSVTWLPPLLVLGVAFAVYKLFFESDS